MTSEQIKEAAERFKTWASDDYEDSDCDYRDDAEHLADDYLARLTADEQHEREDAEPITEEWLRSCMDQEYEGTFANRSMMLGCICEECGRSGWCWIIGNVHIVHLDTRGRLRKLLEALKGGA